MNKTKEQLMEEKEKIEKEEKARLDVLRKKQYLVTAWTEAWAGQFSCQLEIIGVFDTAYEACHFVDRSVEADREDGLKRNADWFDIDPGRSSRPDFWDANSGNKIVYNRYFRIGDGSGFQLCYRYFDVIEIERDLKIGESMFVGNWNLPNVIKGCFERLKVETHFINSGVFTPYVLAQVERAEVAAEYRRLEAIYGHSKLTDMKDNPKSQITAEARAFGKKFAAAVVEGLNTAKHAHGEIAYPEVVAGKAALTKKVHEAVATARSLHRGQYRKGMRSQVPYISHPIAVLELVTKYTDDEDTLIAAVLHDTVEDCGYTFKQIESKFGKNAADLVRELTEDVALKKKSARGTWRERKEKYLAYLRTASPAALLICWADKVHNLKSMAVGFQELGREEFWSRFNAPAVDHAWYYDEIGKIFRLKLEEGPLREFEEALQGVREIF